MMATRLRAILLDMTTTSLGFMPLGQIHMAFSDAYIAPGVGTHRLVLPVEIMGTWLASSDPTSVGPALLIGTAWTSQPHFRWLAGLEPQVLTLRGFAVGEELVLSLSDEQLIALERARGGDDIVLTLKLQVTLLTSNHGIHPISDAETTFRVSRARWLELLDQAGTEVGILMRVPSPLTDSPSEQPSAASAADAASLSQATSRLRQARAELRDHQWEHCVATCRRVLENLDRIVGLPAATTVSRINAVERTQEQRWAAIYYDVKSMASAAHHDDDTTEGFVWSRTDAEAMLAATAGLLARYTAK